MFLSSEQARSSIDCAHQCLHYQQLGGVCNAYSFSNVSLLCELASLTFLEDPLPDQSDGGEKKVMVAAAVLHTVFIQYLHSIYTVSTQYLHSIYTVFAQFLHSIYSISTQYLPTIYTRRCCRWRRCLEAGMDPGPGGERWTQEQCHRTYTNEFYSK